MSLPRFRFAGFVVSPRQRLLVRAGREVPLIPRYFDLLVLLLARRHEAVHRDVIFSSVWSDVVVSDGALTQAVRALRRTLGDDPRESRFIRTVSRHGYRFVCPEVVEEPDEGPIADRDPGERAPVAGSSPPPVEPAVQDAIRQPPRPLEDRDGEIDRWLARLCARELTDDERRDAAERLHVLGTDRAMARLGSRPGCSAARALMRDARWDVPGAGEVPIWHDGGGVGVVLGLARIRAARLWRQAGWRWATGTLGAAAAGLLTGGVGGACLALLPGANAPFTAAPVLAIVGALAGGWGGAWVGAGLSAAEALARSARGAALVAASAAGGALAGWIGRFLVLWTLDALFGVGLEMRGPFEGLVVGAAVGAGYARATSRVTGGAMAAPRGAARLHAAALVAGACAVAAVALGASGRPMVGGLVNALAQATRQSQLSFRPLARAVGEPEFGPVTSAAIGAVEGAAFGFGLTLGLVRRPGRTRSPNPHATLTSR